jgi:hypothetical protein
LKQAGETGDRFVGVELARAAPDPEDLYTSLSIAGPPSSGKKESFSVPLPGKRNSLARYRSPKAWRATITGLSQWGIRRGTFRQMIGSRKMVPSRMFRIVPFGEGSILGDPNSLTRASSWVIVAHLIPTP